MPGTGSTGRATPTRSPWTGCSSPPASGGRTASAATFPCPSGLPRSSFITASPCGLAPHGWPAFSPVSGLQPDGANLTLGASLNYAGNWSLSAGTLALGGKVLTLSGSANLDGGVINGAGTLAVGVPRRSATWRWKAARC